MKHKEYIQNALKNKIPRKKYSPAKKEFGKRIENSLNDSAIDDSQNRSPSFGNDVNSSFNSNSSPKNSALSSARSSEKLFNRHEIVKERREAQK